MQLHRDILNLFPKVALPGGRTVARLVGLSLLVFLPELAQSQQLLHGHIPAAVNKLKLQPKGLPPVSRWLTNCTGLYDGSGSFYTNLFNLTTNPLEFFILK